MSTQAIQAKNAHPAIWLLLIGGAALIVGFPLFVVGMIAQTAAGVAGEGLVVIAVIALLASAVVGITGKVRRS